jgi:hypothetical protein
MQRRHYDYKGGVLVLPKDASIERIYLRILLLFPDELSHGSYGNNVERLTGNNRCCSGGNVTDEGQRERRECFLSSHFLLFFFIISCEWVPFSSKGNNTLHAHNDKNVNGIESHTFLFCLPHEL